VSTCGSSSWIDEGNMSCETTYGFYKDAFARSLTRVPWGDYISVGSTMAYGNDSADVWVVRLDEEGTVLWDSVYGGGYDDLGWDACITSEGDLLICGYSMPSIDKSFDFFLLEVDSSRVLEWQTTFGSEYIEEKFGMELTSDGGCIMVGNVFTDSMYDIDASGRLRPGGALRSEGSHGGNNYR